MIKINKSLIKLKIKKLLPTSILNKALQISRRLNWKGNSRIFCISMQRSGTTSVGDFFKYYGYPTCSYSKARSINWTECWYNGNYDAIFKSQEFLSFQVFEDNPWWNPDFYKILYHRFPNSKFILMYRDSDDWFKSMLSHSQGRTLGNTKRHCKVYRRESEYYKNIEEVINFKPAKNDIDNLMKLEGMANHYKSLYELHNREVIDFFKIKDQNALFHYNLYDENKWYDLGKFIGINVPKGFKMHSHKTKKIEKK